MSSEEAHRATDPTELVLASQSPRRRQLLAQHGYRFRVVAPGESAECGLCSGETPAQTVARLALQKAGDVARRLDRGVVLGCDTLVVCRGQVLGKPVDRRHAQQMLNLLSGRRHSVLSGLCLWRRPDDHRLVEVDVSILRMKPIAADLIEQYLDSGLWEGKAGGFGYQDGHDWLDLIQGSESNVVGLPLELLERMFQRF